jgi:hypothetical protein
MEKIQYFFASVYQSIKRRTPDGTPYFNLCLLITIVVTLNFFNAALILKIWFNVNLLPNVKSQFTVWFISFAVLLIGFLNYIIPRSIIIEIDVSDKDIKRNNLYFLLSIFFCIVLMGVLLIFSRHQ